MALSQSARIDKLPSSGGVTFPWVCIQPDPKLRSAASQRVPVIDPLLPATTARFRAVELRHRFNASLSSYVRTMSLGGELHADRRTLGSAPRLRTPARVLRPTAGGDCRGHI